MRTSRKIRLAAAHPGFTLLEMMIAIVILMIVIGGAVRVFTQSVRSTTFVMQRSEMQNELRAAANEVSRDLQQAGTGIPLGGIPIPNAGVGGGTNPIFGADGTTAYLTVNNVFTDGRLYKVTPGYNASNVGPLRTPPQSDALVIAYTDPNLSNPNAPTNSSWPSCPTTTLASNGTSITMPALCPPIPPAAAAPLTPAVNDPALGITVGDLLLLQNSQGSAVGDVTSVDGPARTITFANGDPLNLNQSAASVGSIPALKSGGTYPAVTVSRIILVTYFLQEGGINCSDICLMRQVGSHTPVPVAEHIVDFRVTYDLFDDTLGAVLANLPDAVSGTPPAAKPNQIRKINLTITARSPHQWTQGSGQPGCSAAGPCWDYLTYTTSIGPRNLSFHDRYN